MPTLADIYSAADSFKRRLSDAAMNPGASLQQMLGYANDRARVLNEMTSAAAQEKDLYGPANQALGQKLAEAYNPAGMVVYHGSPHLFEKFDLGKIGTGEGAQAYGRGLYMAQMPEVAKSYASGLNNPNAAKVLKNLSQSENLVDKAAASRIFYDDQEVAKFIKAKSPNLSDDQINQIVNESGVLYNKISQSVGNLYKVDLPDTHIRRMLDWDASLSNQPKQVRDLAKSLGMDMNDLGGDLVARVGKGEEGKKALEKAGIRGIKYFDQMSRGEATGTRNFVVFDPKHLTILERNAQ